MGALSGRLSSSIHTRPSEPAAPPTSGGAAGSSARPLREVTGLGVSVQLVDLGFEAGAYCCVLRLRVQVGLLQRIGEQIVELSLLEVGDELEARVFETVDAVAGAAGRLREGMRASARRRRVAEDRLDAIAV